MCDWVSERAKFFDLVASTIRKKDGFIVTVGKGMDGLQGGRSRGPAYLSSWARLTAVVSVVLTARLEIGFERARTRPVGLNALVVKDALVTATHV